MRKIIRNLLVDIGFSQIDEADDGSVALSKLHMTQFGVVISDWDMARMSGLELIRKIRGDTLLNATPFIMVTAEASVPKIKAAKEAGVSSYVVKPFNAATLKQKIESVVGTLH